MKNPMRSGAVQFYTLLICGATLLLGVRADSWDTHAQQDSRPHAVACWSEVNERMPDGFERICGDVTKAPSDAREFSDRP